MGDKVIIGIHSQVGSDTQGSLNQLIDGHSWITVTRNGQTERYGLWPDDHPRQINNGAASDIRVGIESGPGFNPTASRYYELTPAQAAMLEQALKENVTWGYTNTCASWAAETTNRVTGQNIDATEFLSIETPRELINSIRALERGRQTSPTDPVRPEEIQQRRSSSYGALNGNPAQFTEVAPEPPGPSEHPLYRQALAGVHQVDATLGRTPDEASERMAASLALLASQSGLRRIDHVLLSEGNGQLTKGENVFVVEGDLHDPTHLRAHMKTEIAVSAPVAESFRRFDLANQQQAVLQQNLDIEQPRQQQHRHVVS